MFAVEWVSGDPVIVDLPELVEICKKFSSGYVLTPSEFVPRGWDIRDTSYEVVGGLLVGRVTLLEDR